MGWIVFALFLLAVYSYNFASIPLSAPAIRTTMYRQIFETVGIAVLVYVTLAPAALDPDDRTPCGFLYRRSKGS
ncbi:MAG: hypothetical protein ACOCQL_07180 [Halolamina sp.]